LGLQGRAGYSFPVGVYVGGNVQAYYGNGVSNARAHATFIGAEGGYKFFPLQAMEMRPYVFLGPAFITQVSNNTVSSSKTGFAVQPGALFTYHIGQAFVGADSHLLATPSPFSIAVMGTAGAGF
jgi:hypothetical protein